MREKSCSKCPVGVATSSIQMTSYRCQEVCNSHCHSDPHLHHHGESGIWTPRISIGRLAVAWVAVVAAVLLFPVTIPLLCWRVVVASWCCDNGRLVVVDILDDIDSGVVVATNITVLVVAE